MVKDNQPNELWAHDSMLVNKQNVKADLWRVRKLLRTTDHIITVAIKFVLCTALTQLREKSHHADITGPVVWFNMTKTTSHALV